MKLIPAQTGNRIADMWDCSEILITDLQRGKTCVRDKDKLNEIIKINEMI